MRFKIYNKETDEVLDDGFTINGKGMVVLENGDVLEERVILKGFQIGNSKYLFIGDIMELNLEENGFPLDYMKNLLKHFRFERIPESFDSIIIELIPNSSTSEYANVKFKLNGEYLQEDEESVFLEGDYAIPTGLDFALKFANRNKYEVIGKVNLKEYLN